MAANPTVEQQRIVVENSYGEKLVGVLHETGSSEIVICCHGFRASKDHFTMTNTAIALAKQGITAFRFDFAGNGESEGSFEYGNYRREADDLRAVIQHFRGLNRVITAILGHSKGGGVVLLYASKYQDVPTVVNASGRYDLKGGLEDKLGKDFLQRIKKDGFLDIKSKTDSYRITEESFMERMNTSMEEACLQIVKECRVLIIHGSADESVPVEDAFKFAKIIPNHKLHIVEGADHCFTSHQNEMTPPIVAFIKEGLQHGKED